MYCAGESGREVRTTSARVTLLVTDAKATSDLSRRGSAKLGHVFSSGLSISRTTALLAPVHQLIHIDHDLVN